MQFGKSKFVIGGLFAAALFASTAAHANLVSNGGFETGDFTGWTAAVTAFDGVDGAAPQDGTSAAFFGNTNGTSTISQGLATVAGTKYDVSFWLANEADVTGLAAPNTFLFDWDGANVTTLTDASAFGYTQYSFQLTATSALTQLSFAFGHTPAFWDFDSVSVEVAAVPEPGSLALTALAGALAVIIPRRRRQQKLLAAQRAA